MMIGYLCLAVFSWLFDLLYINTQCVKIWKKGATFFVKSISRNFCEIDFTKKFVSTEGPADDVA